MRKEESAAPRFKNSKILNIFWHAVNFPILISDSFRLIEQQLVYNSSICRQHSGVVKITMTDDECNRNGRGSKPTRAILFCH